MFVSDLFDKAELEAHIADGYVSVRAHDEYPLSVLNYTSRAAFDYRWNHVTKTCRGLVIDHETDRVVARPFPKFFGVSEYAADELDAMGSFEIFDKLDGSLGVLVQGYGGPLIATRGVFHGPQAEHATALLSDRYADVRFPAGVTAMFEIVYPQNRIIVDYGEMDDLVYLGAVGLDGAEVDAERYWPGPTVEKLGTAESLETIPDSIAQRAGAEGLVLRFGSGVATTRIKIKQDDYVSLHRALFNTSPKALRRVFLEDPGSAIRFVADLPEQIQPEFRTMLRDLMVSTDEVLDGANELFSQMQPVADEPRLLAEAMGTHELRTLVFHLSRGRDIAALARKIACERARRGA